MKNKNRVAVITGASQGIGKAVAQELLREGYNVVFSSRREDELKKAVEEVKAFQKQALVVPTDVSDKKSVANLFQRTIEKFERVDFLFNNAGWSPSGNFIEDIPYSDWKKTIDINLTGAFFCTQEAIRIMKKQNPQGGRILNNGSVAAHAPRSKFGAYATSKHALTGLTKATALEGRDFNIACGQIDLGNVGTELLERLATNEAKMPMDSVAKMIVQMASLPLQANVLFTTMLATQMPFVGRG